jgi:hypothetical protein
MSNLVPQASTREVISHAAFFKNMKANFGFTDTDFRTTNDSTPEEKRAKSKNIESYCAAFVHMGVANSLQNMKDKGVHRSVDNRGLPTLPDSGSLAIRPSADELIIMLPPGSGPYIGVHLESHKLFLLGMGYVC